MSSTSSSNTTVGAVNDLFSSLEQLQKNSNSIPEPGIKDACVKAVTGAERVVECLDHRTREYNCAKNDVEIISGWLRQAVRKLVKVNKELAQFHDEKKFDREMKLADTGLDPRSIDISSSSLSSALSHSTSYESLKQQKKLSSSVGGGVRSATASPQPVFSIRKARSDPDITAHTMQKEVDALKIDNKRLKGSEKKLLKETLQLGRKCRGLEDEKNRAENRLMIEQTQRDSTEKLRQRNRELEQQVQKLKQEYEVIKQKDKEAAE